MQLITKQLVLLDKEDRKRLMAGELIEIALSDGNTIDLSFNRAKAKVSPVNSNGHLNGEQRIHKKIAAQEMILSILIARGQAMKHSEITQACPDIDPTRIRSVVMALVHKNRVERVDPYIHNGMKCFKYKYAGGE